MSEATIGPARDGDLAEILRTFERFWGDHPGSGRARVVMRRPLTGVSITET